MRTVGIFLNQLFRDVRHQKMRTFLTMFGIIWGTASVVLLLAFGTGMQAMQVKSVKGLGEYICIMWPGRTSLPYQGMPKNRVIRLKEEDAALLKREIPVIGGCSPEYSAWNVKARVGRNERLIRVTGCWPEFADIRNIIPQRGSRFFSETDKRERRRVIFLGNRLADDLFGKGVDPVGEIVTINNVPFLVIGVMKHKDQDSSYNGRDTQRAFIASSVFKAVFGREYVNNLVYRATDPKWTETMKKSVYEVLGRKYKFDPDDSEALAIWDTTENLRFFQVFFGAFKGFLGVIGVFTLIVGGIGISNIMNVVVEERTREIGIKMALGAKRHFVLSQFLVETLALTAIGGLVGFLFSLGVIGVFPMFQLEEYVGTPAVDNLVAFSTVGVLSLIGLLAGYFPARRAARLNPVEALRL